MASRATLCILGIPVRITAGDPRLLTQACRALEEWHHLDPEPGAVELRIRLSAAPITGGEPLRIEVATDAVLMASGGGSAGRAHAGRGAAAARMPVRDWTPRHDELLHTLTLWLLTHRGRPPLHAAALMRGDAALLLAGPSGIGKSSLAYAATRAGLRLLAEDTVYLQRTPRLRAWGIPGVLHLLADSPLFPELGAIKPQRRPNDKLKRRVEVPRPERPWSERLGVCVLARGRAAAVEPVTAEEWQTLAGRAEPGFDHFAGEAARALEGCPTWRLQVPEDPAAVIPLLHALLDQL